MGARMFDGRAVILSRPRRMTMRLTPSLPGTAEFNAACSAPAIGLKGCGTGGTGGVAAVVVAAGFAAAVFAAAGFVTAGFVVTGAVVARGGRAGCTLGFRTR